MLEKYHIPDRAMLCDVQYIRPNKKEQKPDVLYIIWKDLDTLEKHLTTIENPTVEVYFEKPSCRNHPRPRTYQYIQNLEKREVRYADIIQEIVNDGGQPQKDKLSDIYRSGNFSRMKEMFLYPFGYGTDYNIEALYRFYWLKEKDNNYDKPITKGFADIEVDFVHAKGFPEPASCPIDVITIIDSNSSTSYTFMLMFRQYHPIDIEKHKENMRPADYEKYKQVNDYFIKLYEGKHKQQQEFMDNIDDIQKEIHELFDENYGKLEYKFFFYEDEKKMLIHVFQLINSLKLDFLEFWNFTFDIPFIYERAKYLRIDPTVLFCHPDFKYKQCWFKEDKRHYEIKNKTDYFYCSSYTTYLCQMRTYAATRKGRQELRSFNLNYIGKKEIKDEKLDYSEDGNLKTLSYRNFKEYIIYNIKDVLLQHGIEKVTRDLDNAYSTSYMCITPYDSIFKQTVKLRNVQYLSYFDQGVIPGPNTNIFNSSTDKDDNDDDDVGFEGALVGDPRLNLRVGMPLYGKPTNNLFEFAIDMDMSAFYPSTIRANNIDPSTLIFKVIMNAAQFSVLGGDKKINTMSHIPLLPKEESGFKDDVGKECFDNFQTGNVLSTGHKWLNLPSLDKMYRKLVKKMGN